MSEHPALVAAASVGLPGLSRIVEIPPADASDVLGVAHLDRLGGFLGRARQQGLVVCDDDTGESIDRMWHEQLATSVSVEAFTVRIAAVLDDSGVAWRLTKGAALAHLDYRDPSLRMFGDVDVVVAASDWKAALSALDRAAVTRREPELRPGFDTRYGKGATLEDPLGFELDAHVRFAVGRYGLTSRMEDLFAVPAVPLPLGGRVLPVLAAEDRLVHACFHAVLGGARHLRALRDVAQLLLLSGVPADPVIERARRWKADAVIAAAVQECWQVFELEHVHDLHDWASGVEVGRAERAAIETFRTERSFRRQTLTGLDVLPWKQRPQYLWALTGRRLDVRGRRRSAGSEQPST